MVVKEITTEKQHTLKMSVDKEPSSDSIEKPKGFQALSEKEKANVERTLFLMDKFAVGDSFIHELVHVTWLKSSKIILN